MIPKHNKPDNTDFNANKVEEDKDVASKYSDEMEEIVPKIKINILTATRIRKRIKTVFDYV